MRDLFLRHEVAITMRAMTESATYLVLAHSLPHLLEETGYFFIHVEKVAHARITPKLVSIKLM